MPRKRKRGNTGRGGNAPSRSKTNNKQSEEVILDLSKSISEADNDDCIIVEDVNDSRDNNVTYSSNEIGLTNKENEMEKSSMTNSNEIASVINQNPSASTNIDIYEDSDSDDDLYNVDYANKKKYDFVNLSKSLPKQIHNEVPTSPRNSEHTEIEDNDSVQEKAPTNVDSDDSDDITLSPINTNSLNIKIPNTKSSKRSKKVKMLLSNALKSVQQNIVDEFDDSTDIILVDNAPEEMVLVRLCWGASYKHYSMSLVQPLSYLYNILSEEKNTIFSKIVLTMDGKVLSPSSTLKEVKYSVGNTIEGGILEQPSESNEDLISLKIQNANKKEVVTLKLSKYEKMIVLIKDYCKLKKIDISTVIFKFDGEKLTGEETPFSLDLEGDECIDAYTK